ncbi:MAG TPA: proteasome activator [Acidimicrobiales bacterium]|nr:proteasome activator [Acidimicrobiales bacterium]
MTSPAHEPPDEAEAAGGPPDEAGGLVVERPTDLMRVEGELEALAVELRQLAPDSDSDVRRRLSRIVPRIASELADATGQPMRRELHTLFGWLEEEGLTADELRVGVAGLLGWVEGVISGLRFAVAMSMPPLSADMMGDGGPA